MLNFIKIVLILFILSYSALICAKVISHLDYESNWREPYSGEFIPIGRNLVNKGCGIFYIKQNKDGSSEYRVKCIDSKNIIRYYLVWPTINKIQGPFKKESDLNF